MDNSANKKLLEAAESWTAELFEPYVQKFTDSGIYAGKDKKRTGDYISCPFYVGLSEEYIQNKERKTRVMIIGQEARHYGSWFRDKEKKSYQPECSQAWGLEYLNKQLDYTFNGRFKISYNFSRFWNLFRTLNKNRFVVCWNNLDKVYFGKDENYKGTLTYDAEEVLSARYGTENKSLIEREIKIAEPDVLLFITGPSYAISMEKAFGVENRLIGKLDKNNKICDITEIIHLGIPAFWTYHPANRQGIHSAKLFLQKYNA